VNDVLTRLQAQPAIIVGHSFGAGSAAEFAMRYPARSRALVLVDAALGLTSPPSEPRKLLQPKWIREVLVSLTITNPLATKKLLQSLIEKKERAAAIYRHPAAPHAPARQHCGYCGLALLLRGLRRHGAERRWRRLRAAENSRRDHLGREGYRHADGIGARPAAAPASVDTHCASGSRSYPANRGSRCIQRRFAQGDREHLSYQCTRAFIMCDGHATGSRRLDGTCSFNVANKCEAAKDDVRVGGG
jgi:pimeloyl-ACP methyl ester carboxylesterase